MLPNNLAWRVITARSQTCRKDLSANLEHIAWLVNPTTQTAPKALTGLNLAVQN
jgi:Tfp pilus assembly protein PilN